MRQSLDELRQVRKEEAVIAIVVCCGVPGLFCDYIFKNALSADCEWVSLACNEEAPQIIFFIFNEQIILPSHCPEVETQAVFGTGGAGSCGPYAR